MHVFFRPERLRPLPLILTLLLPALSTHAQTDWLGPGSGAYNDPSKWSGSNVPDTASESARFKINATYDVEFAQGSSTTILDLLVNEGTVSFQSPDAGSDATLNIDNSATINGGDLTLDASSILDPDVNLLIGNDLSVLGTNTLSVFDGAQVTVSDRVSIGTAGGADATLRVSGVGSAIEFAGDVKLGLSGGSGTLTVSSFSSGSTIAGPIDLAVSSVNGSQGELNVSGTSAALETGDLNVGTTTSSSATAQVATVNLTSSSSLTQTGASTLVVGSAANNNIVAEVNLGTGSIFNTGTGDITIQNTGDLSVSGTFNANGDISIQNGGNLIVSSGNVNANGNVTVDGATITSGSLANFNLGTGLTLLARNGAFVQLSSLLTINDDTTWIFESGADFQTTAINENLTVGSATDGTLVVDGTSSSLTRGPSAETMIGDQAAGTMTVRNDADFEFLDLTIGPDSAGGGHGTLNIENTTRPTATSLTLATNSSSPADAGILNITSSGPASRLTLLGNAGTTVGDATPNTSGPAEIHVTGTSARFTSGTGPCVINPPGLIEVDAGTAEFLADTLVNGGTLRTVNSGYLGLAGGTTVTAQNNGVIDLDGFVRLQNDTTIHLKGAASLTHANILTLGSRLTTTTGTLIVEESDTTAILGQLNIGEDADGPGIAMIKNGGALTTSGAAVFNKQGTMTIDGGSANFGFHLHEGGRINFLSGSLTSGSDWVIEGGGLLGHLVELTPGMHLGTTGSGDDLILEPGGTIILNGGSLDVDQIVNNGGNIIFLSGTLTQRASNGLTVGASGIFGSALTLGAGQDLVLSDNASIESGAVLTLDGGTINSSGILSNSGTVVVGSGSQLTAQSFDNNASGLLVAESGSSIVLSALNLANSGEIYFGGASSRIQFGGPSYSNLGLIRGSGTFSGNLTNLAGGELRVQTGDLLRVTGTNGSNTGLLNLQGGVLTFDDALTNSASGDILGRGILSVGGSGLTNLGDLALSNGQSDVFGDVDNQGRVIISGNADLTFWDDVTHTGSLFNVSSGSSITFFGQAGFGVSGGGDVFFESDITPGSSPGLESFGGNVFFGAISGLEIEIAGPTPGTGFDQLAITGGAELAGTLHVALLDGFDPIQGDTFTFLTAGGGVAGTFPLLDFSAAPLGPNLAWQVNYTASSVELEVISILTPFEQWIASFPSLSDPADKTKTANPDGDRLNNLGEFALDSNPTHPLASGKIVVKIAPVGGVDVLTLTVPIRLGATPAAGDPSGGELALEQLADHLRYAIQAGKLDESGGFATWPLDVTEVTGPDASNIQSGLPPLSPGWEYRTFRSPGAVASDPHEFMRVEIESLSP